MYEPRHMTWQEYYKDWYEWRQEVAYFEEQPNFIPEPSGEVKTETVNVEPTAEEIAQREARELYVECHRD